MKWKSWIRLMFALALILAIMVSTVTSARPSRASDVLTFDIAENAAWFVSQQEPVFEEDGYPAYGNPFLTQGYIYPGGTLNGSNGVLENGEPEFPDQVIGRWVCRGWVYAADGFHAESGALVVTSQVFQLGQSVGAESLMTEGFDLADINRANERAVVGGTGQYVGARGVQVETLLGYNRTQGVDFHVELHLED
jgi:hypothetical protein